MDLACSRCSAETCAALLKEGDVNHTFDFQTPLQWAVSSKIDTLEKVQMLIAAGADVNVRNEDGKTRLHDASYIQTDNIEVLLCLLEAKADPFVKDNCGRTPLEVLHAIYFPTENPWGGQEMYRREVYPNMVILVAAGDRNWQCVPSPCPGLEGVLKTAWKEAPEELQELFRRLEAPVQKKMQNVLRVLHRNLSRVEELRTRILFEIFADSRYDKISQI